MHSLIVHNDEIRDVRETSLSPGQVGFLNGWGVFSTLRVDHGVLFAFERHWARMQRDAKLLHVPFPAEPDWMRGRLLKLVEANRAENATLRVVVVRNQGGPYTAPGIHREFDLIAFTTDLTEWPDSVSLGIKPHARHAKSEFSGAKILSWSFNLTWNEEAHQRGFDEMLLLNERGEIAECTSANLFAIEGKRVWTPPLDSGCLPGVTRAILLEEIQLPEITIREATLDPADLERMDRVLITSTTRDLLPVKAIETLRLGSGGQEVLETLQAALRTYRQDYIAKASFRANIPVQVPV